MYSFYYILIVFISILLLIILLIFTVKTIATINSFLKKFIMNIRFKQKMRWYQQTFFNFVIVLLLSYIEILVNIWYLLTNDKSFMIILYSLILYVFFLLLNNQCTVVVVEGAGGGGGWEEENKYSSVMFQVLTDCFIGWLIINLHDWLTWLLVCFLID